MKYAFPETGTAIQPTGATRIRGFERQASSLCEKSELLQKAIAGDVVEMVNRAAGKE